MHIRYFSETTLRHLKPRQGLSERHRRRALDVTLACKLTLTYGLFHSAMLHRELFMGEKKTSYQQAERMAGMILYPATSSFILSDKMVEVERFLLLQGYNGEYSPVSVALLLCILLNYPFAKSSRNSADVIIRADAGK